MKSQLKTALDEETSLAESHESGARIIMLTPTGTDPSSWNVVMETVRHLHDKVGYRCLLIDARILQESADVESVLESENTSPDEDLKGLSGYLRAPSQQPSDLVETDGENSWDVVFGGSGASATSQLLLRVRFGDLFASLKGNYDYIIVATLPVDQSPIPKALAGLVDQNVIIVRERKTGVWALNATWDELTENGAKQLSVLLDQRPPKWLSMLKNIFGGLWKKIRRNGSSQSQQ